MSLKKSATLIALAASVIAPASASAADPFAVVKSTDATIARSNTGTAASRVMTAGTSYDITVVGNYTVYGQSLFNQRDPKAYWKTCGTPTPLVFQNAAEDMGKVGGQDAERIYSIPVARGCGNVTAQLPFTAPASGGLRLSIDGTKNLTNPTPVSSDPTTHTYVYRVIGQGFDPRFLIADSNRADNAGRLRASWAPTTLPNA